MNNENESVKENIFFKMANEKKRSSLFSIENIIAFVVLFLFLGLGYLAIYNMEQSKYTNIINIILFLGTMVTCILGIFIPWIQTRLNYYTILDNKEIDSLYKTIEKDRNLVLKTNQLYKKQGFIIEKQKDEILDEFYKKQEKIIEEHKKQVLDEFYKNQNLNTNQI